VSGRTLLLLGWMCAVSLGALSARSASAQATARATARSLWLAANRAAVEGRPDEYRRLMASA